MGQNLLTHGTESSDMCTRASKRWLSSILYRALSSVNVALLSVYRALLSVCRALLSVYRALLSVYRALSSVKVALLSVYRALLSVCRALLTSAQIIPDGVCDQFFLPTRCKLDVCHS